MRVNFIWPHRKEKLSMFNFCLTEPDGQGYSLCSHGTRPDIWGNPASHLGMCVAGIKASISAQTHMIIQFIYLKQVIELLSTNSSQISIAV